MKIGLWKHNISGYWHLDIQAKNSTTGKRLRPSLGVKKKSTAERLRARAEQGHLEQVLGWKAAKPRNQFLDDYLAHISSHFSPTTQELYNEIVPRVLKACDWPPNS